MVAPPRSRLIALSVSHYAFLLIGVMVLLFAAVGFVAYERMHQVRLEVEAADRRAAARELRDAVEAVQEDLLADAARLAAWDELRQQLSQPTYYAYWRELRLQDSPFIEDYIVEAEVYGANGRALALQADTVMPLDLTDTADGVHFFTRHGQLHVLAVAAVTGNDGRHLGRVALRADLLAAFRGLGSFQRLERQSLSADPLPPHLAPVGDGARHLKYAVLEAPERAAMEAVVRNAILQLLGGMTVLAALFYISMVVLLSRPLLKISQHIDTLRENPGGMILEPPVSGLAMTELEKVRASINDYQCRLEEVRHTLDEKNRELWDLAHLDPLTGVLNRRGFDDNWRQVRELFADLRVGVCFALFDCNHFKAINDTYGHDVGDEVLKAIAESIGQSLRRGDKLYRIGGDEFAAILLDCNAPGAMALAERCQAAVKAYPFNRLGIQEPVRVSIGIATVNARSEGEIDDLRWQADMAMYTAKRPGGDHVTLYAPDMAVGAKSLFSNWSANVVYEAITEGRGIAMAYQPIVDLTSGRTAYYEALVRIERDGERVLPSHIFPLVEARRLEPEFDRAVIQAVGRDLRAGLLAADSGVSINISGPTAVKAELVEWLAPLLEHAAGARLVLEVTETALITQLDRAREVLEQVRRMGFLIALDDFGSGYSSLRYLSRMPVDVVKFDISLVRQLGEERRQHTIVRRIADLVREAGYAMVAEGVENEDMLHNVQAAGFDYGQGYLFGHPGHPPRLAATHHPSAARVTPIRRRN